MSDECVFCKIVQKAIPAAVVYEDADTIAILDLHPVRPGHLLVIPRRHSEDFLDMEESNYATVMRVAHTLARVVSDVVTPTRVGLLINGFGVPHVHVHLIPLEGEFEIMSSLHGKHLPPQATPEYFAEFVEKFKQKING